MWHIIGNRIRKENIWCKSEVIILSRSKMAVRRWRETSVRLFTDGFALNSIFGGYLGREKRKKHWICKSPQIFKMAVSRERETSVLVVYRWIRCPGVLWGKKYKNSIGTCKYPQINKMAGSKLRGRCVSVVYRWIFSKLGIQGFFGSRKTKIALVFVCTHNFPK